jgi:CRISPR-associated endonuclease/helicase Cas3
MNMDPNHLWAKSKRNDEPVHPSMFLPRHLVDVYEAAVQVLDATGDDQLRALGLEPGNYRERLHRIVLLAAACHDLGKANDHFQRMLLGKRDPQGLRHEWVSLLIVRELRAWLLPAVCFDERDFAIVEWSVCGHHPAHNHASPPKGPPAEGGHGPEIHILTGHDDFTLILQWLRLGLGVDLGDAPTLTDRTRNLVGSNNVFAEIANWANAARREWETRFKGPEARLVAAAKNCLIAADVAGSALPKKLPNDSECWGWITQSFDSKPKPNDLQFIVDWRLGREKRKGRDGKLLPFQEQLADSTSDVTFVKAGCGSGKTLAAYLWAARQHPGKRLYFCYPTTGTATEGFKDYLSPSEIDPDEDEAAYEGLKQIEADLFHSRRDVDFEIILNTGADEKNADTDAAIRIESLDAWSTPIVACTVDTVLGLVQNNKRGLFAWPALAQSAFVFDEIHAYDDKLFGALLRFLRDLPGLPSLLMTASLPMPREEALRITLKKFRNIELAPIAGPKELEELPRYHKATTNGNDPLPLVRETFKNGGKVLWVCNTVKRVMDAAQAAEEAGLEPMLYHSRFKYEDRVRRHKHVIEAFDPSKNPRAALAICSQVAEMSLDLSADLLVTDLAPVPALIQRLGRLNRRAKNGDKTKPFIVVEMDKYGPYVDATGEPDPVNWPEITNRWFERLPDIEISQRHLADCWEHGDDETDYREYMKSTWLDGGPKSEVIPLRETSEGITVLMEEDLSKVRANPKSLGRYTLPMLKGPKDWQQWHRERGLPVAPDGTINYCSQRGAEWRKS